MEVMFKVKVPDGANVYWNDFLGFLQEVAPSYDEHIGFSFSGPTLSAGGQSEVFADVYSLLDCIPNYHIQFGRVCNKVYCLLIPFKPAQIDNSIIGVASCREGDDFSYKYGCILAFARAFKDEDLESRILMCDPQAAEEYFGDIDFDMIY